ncbi:MAG: hypothetical protein EOP04_00770 [Proteobacteria bacterium]|nr:MAG: hypothetical protein EOP04_00770 [Pseudomonadota bacterium]
MAINFRDELAHGDPKGFIAELFEKDPGVSPFLFEFFARGNFTPETQRSYSGLLKQFAHWLSFKKISLTNLRAPQIADFLEGMETGASRKRAMLAFVKSFLGSLEVQGYLDRNAAGSIRPGKNPYRDEGATQALSREDLVLLVSYLKEKSEGGSPVALRDYALISVLIETWSRIEPVCSLTFSDYVQSGRQRFLRLEEKGLKIQLKALDKRVHRIVDDYIAYSGVGGGRASSLFRSANGRGGKLSETPLSTRGAREVVKTRGEEVGLKGLHPHMFRVTGLNHFRSAGGSSDDAQKKMGHTHWATTKTYERKNFINSDAIADSVGLFSSITSISSHRSKWMGGSRSFSDEIFQMFKDEISSNRSHHESWWQNSACSENILKFDTGGIVVNIKPFSNKDNQSKWCVAYRFDWSSDHESNDGSIFCESNKIREQSDWTASLEDCFKKYPCKLDAGDFHFFISESKCESNRVLTSAVPALSESNLSKET